MRTVRDDIANILAARCGRFLEVPGPRGGELGCIHHNYAKIRRQLESEQPFYRRINGQTVVRVHMKKWNRKQSFFWRVEAEVKHYERDLVAGDTVPNEYKYIFRKITTSEPGKRFSDSVIGTLWEDINRTIQKFTKNGKCKKCNVPLINDFAEGCKLCIPCYMEACIMSSAESSTTLTRI